MKILVTIGAGLLLTTTALAQVNEEVVDGKKLDKEKMELHDYLPAIHGTIRAKYEYQTATDESRFQVRNARFSLTGNVLPDRKSTRLNSSHSAKSRMPSSA